MSSCVDVALDTGEKVEPSWGVGLRGNFGGDRGRMSKKGRANRTPGAPKSSPSVRALRSASDAPPSSKSGAVEKGTDPKAKPKTASDAPPSSKSAVEKGADPKVKAAESEPKSPESKAQPKDARDQPSKAELVSSSDHEKTESDHEKADTAVDPKVGPRPSSRPPNGESRPSSDAPSDEPVPQAKDLDDESFFAEGSRRSSMPPPIEGDSADERTVRLLEDPEVLARRAKSVKMVRYVVAAFTMLLAIGAVAKLREAPPPPPKAPVFIHGETTPSSSAETQVKPTTTAETTAAPTPSASAVAMDASVAIDSGGVDSGGVDSGGVDSGAVGTSSLSPDAGIVEGEAGVLSVDSGLDAKALKRACQRALDSGKLAQAIENGEASVAADPTDGEAWLLLGAAYDQKGRAADARTAYQSCVQKGKRGPVGECAALLR